MTDCPHPCIDSARRSTASTQPGTARARLHCRVALPSIRVISEWLIYSVPLFLKRQCDRTLGTARPRRRSRAGAIRLDLSGPLLESLIEKRQSFSEESGPDQSKRMVRAGRGGRGPARPARRRARRPRGGGRGRARGTTRWGLSHGRVCHHSVKLLGQLANFGSIL
jgi:hypothetical protein